MPAISLRSLFLAAIAGLAMLEPVPFAIGQSEFFDCALTKSLGEDPMIDDLEDDDLFLLAQDGRNGMWYSFDDGTDGQQAMVVVPTADSPGSGNKALYIAGEGWTGWGAGFGVSFNINPNDESFCFYDTRPYTGIQFWIRATGFTETRIYGQTPSVVPISEGGDCDSDRKGCWNSHSYPFEVTEDWAFVQIPFASLKQEQPPIDGKFDASQVRAIDFAVPANGAYEVWIDELSFYIE